MVVRQHLRRVRWAVRALRLAAAPPPGGAGGGGALAAVLVLQGVPA